MFPFLELIDLLLKLLVEFINSIRITNLTHIRITPDQIPKYKYMNVIFFITLRQIHYIHY